MNIKFIYPTGRYCVGDFGDMQPGLARQMIAEGKAVECISPNQMTIAELRAIANREPKPKAGRRKLSRSEIDALYRRTFKGQPFAHGRCVAIR
jgi:hypothetical protein